MENHTRDMNFSIPLQRTLDEDYDNSINAPQPPPLDPSIESLQNTLGKMQTYASPCIFCIGIPLNMMSLILIAKWCIKKASMTQYLCVILIADVTLLTNLLLVWLTQRGFDLYRLGALCHFTSFVSQSSSFLSLWFSVCLAVDGFIRTCCNETKSKKLCTKIRARVVILCLVACATAVYLNISLMVGVFHVGTKNVCYPLNQYVATLNTLDKIDIFVNVILPYSGLGYLFLHTCIVYLMQNVSVPAAVTQCLQMRGHKTYGKEVNPPSNMQNREENTTLQTNDSKIERAIFVRKEAINISLCLVMFTLILNVPSASLRTYNTMQRIFFPNRPMTMDKYLWQQLLQYPYYLKSACNFFLLLLASGAFRESMVGLIISSSPILSRIQSVVNRNSENGRERVSIEADPDDPEV